MKLSTLFLSTSLLLSSSAVLADEYIIDSKGMHASILFKIQHLGYSWLTGQFNSFEGGFNYDASNPEASTITVTIDTKSIDTNHAERDKHLRSDDFLDVSKHPQAVYKGTSYVVKDDNSGIMKGTLTLNGQTQPLDLMVTKIGEGADPWGGQRIGFEATTSFNRYDFGIDQNLGPKSQQVDLNLHIEGIKK